MFYVYALRDSMGTVFYIGQTKDPTKRLASHAADKWAGDVTDMVRSLPGVTMLVLSRHDTRAEALDEERRMVMLTLHIVNRLSSSADW